MTSHALPSGRRLPLAEITATLAAASAALDIWYGVSPGNRAAAGYQVVDALQAVLRDVDASREHMLGELAQARRARDIAVEELLRQHAVQAIQPTDWPAREPTVRLVDPPPRADPALRPGGGGWPR